MILESLADSVVTKLLLSGVRLVLPNTRKGRPLEPRLADGLITIVQGEKLDAPFRSVVAGPTEAVILVKNGVITDIFREEKVRAVSAAESIRTIIGFGPEVTALKVDLRPFQISVNFGPSKQFQVVSQSGDQLAGTVIVTLAFDPESAIRAVWWSGTTESLGVSDIEKRLQHELVSAMQPVLSAAPDGEVRSAEIQASVESEIQNRLSFLDSTYALIGERVTVVWGLSKNEQMSTELDELEMNEARAASKAKIRDSKAGTGSYTEIHGNVTNTTHSGLSGVWIVLLVLVVLAGIASVLFLLR